MIIEQVLLRKNMARITFGFVLLTVITVTAHGEQDISSCQQRRRLSQFYRGPLKDHVLRGKGIREVTTRLYQRCAELCLHEDTCKSFNFCQDDRRCELNSAVYSEDKSDLQPSSGCLYYDEEAHGECEDVVSTASINTFPFPPLNSSQMFRLDFAAKGADGARVALSERANEENYYDIIIGSHGNTYSLIRPDRFTFDEDEYYVLVSTPDIMTEYEYRRFWISFDEGTIQVGRGGEVAPFMQWHDVTRRVNVNYVGIRVYDEPTTWVFYTFCDE